MYPNILLLLIANSLSSHSTWRNFHFIQPRTYVRTEYYLLCSLNKKSINKLT